MSERRFDHFALVCLCCDCIIAGTESSTYEQAERRQRHYPDGMTGIIGYERVYAGKPPADAERTQ